LKLNLNCIECGSTNIQSYDKEGQVLCLDCGLVFCPDKTGLNSKCSVHDIVRATPVKELPEGKKPAKIPEYDAVFKQIIESPEKMFKVEVEGKTVRSMYAPFTFRVKCFNRKPKKNLI
jgi:hypothetical protein